MLNTAWSYSRLDQFENCPKRYWHTTVAKDFPEPKSDAQTYGTKVHKALELRVSKNAPLPKELSHLERIAVKFVDAPGIKLVEQQLAINEQFTPVKWFAKDVWCRAIVDLAVINKDRAVVVDYKTGKMSDDFTQQRLATVMLMLHHKTIQTAEMIYLWLASKKITRGFLIREDTADVWSEFLPRVKRFQHAYDNTQFPARPSGLCKQHCHVVSCPHNGSYR